MDLPPPFVDAVPSDGLTVVGEGLPPRGVELDGVWRKRGREIGCAAALRLSERS